jgi:DNA adenine methylase
MFNMKPLYMWAGGKNKMISKYKISPGIPLNNYETFIEPFFGGGAMMIYIYKNNLNVKRFVINDINPEIIGLYKSIKTNVKTFIQRLDVISKQYLPLDKVSRKSFYYDLREEYTTDWNKWNSIDESATLYFLMKTGFNGIWQTNINSNGRFATPAGLLNQTKTVYDINNLYEWNLFLQNCDIYSRNWKDACPYDEKRCFLFFDPPYRNSFTQYAQSFGDAEHLKLIRYSNERTSMGDFVMYCNRDAGDNFYIDNKENLSIKYYPISYTAGRRKKNEDGSHSAKSATEVLLYSPAIEDNKNYFTNFFEQ